VCLCSSPRSVTPVETYKRSVPEISCKAEHLRQGNGFTLPESGLWRKISMQDLPAHTQFIQLHQNSHKIGRSTSAPANSPTHGAI
jgi:hypothetical protein